MSNFQNIGYLIKTPKKTAPKQFFKGVAHEQHWSSIVCLLWWSSIVSGFFWSVFFPKSFSHFLCYSFCLLLGSILLASSPWFLWCFYGISGISKTFLWELYGISIVFLWYSMVFLKGCLWYLYGIPMAFQKDVYSMGFLLGSYGVSMRFLWDFFWGFHDTSIRFLW